MDESQMRQLIEQSNLEDPEKGVLAVHSTKYRDLLGKCRVLIKAMNRYHSLSTIPFVLAPHHLDKKFVRSFAMAVKQNKTSVVQLFPKKSVKTRYVCLTKSEDYQEFAEKKKTKQLSELITTPLHLACQMSNMEAARILLTNQNFDVNILVHEKNFIYDLLNTASWEDFNILSNVFKKRQPCVNSG